MHRSYNHLTICKPGEYREVIYKYSRWRVLKRKRERALEIMHVFIQYGFTPYVYGSLARGDVHEDSDIDITFLIPIDPSLIETILDYKGFAVRAKYIIMATPRYPPKAYLWLDYEGKESISVFLSKPTPRAVEFYKFGGLLDYIGLLDDKRVAGVDKRLMLIEPTRKGHIESCIIGREGEVAKILGVNQNVVLERVRKLTKRRRVGRTGVYLEYKLRNNESFGEAIAYLKRVNKFFSKKVREF